MFPLQTYLLCPGGSNNRPRFLCSYRGKRVNYSMAIKYGYGFVGVRFVLIIYCRRLVALAISLFLFFRIPSLGMKQSYDFHRACLRILYDYKLTPNYSYIQKNTTKYELYPYVVMGGMGRCVCVCGRWRGLYPNFRIRCLSQKLHRKGREDSGYALPTFILGFWYLSMSLLMQIVSTPKMDPTLFGPETPFPVSPHLYTEAWNFYCKRTKDTFRWRYCTHHRNIHTAVLCFILLLSYINNQ